MLGKYVVAFNRDRDSYQVPLALQEMGCLEKLVTDIYLPSLLAHSALGRMLRMSHRNDLGLPFTQVVWSWRALWLQLFSLRLARTEQDRVQIFRRLDCSLSQQAGHIAENTAAGLYLYSGYALEAFQSQKLVDREKILFVYHPHSELFRKLLDDDLGTHPEVVYSHRLHLDEIQNTDRIRLCEELRLADKIVCASSVTKASVEAVIGTSKPILVVPYGCAVTNFARNLHRSSSDRPQLLFVGQGVQRKGLHHLLKVWARRIDWGADLTVVSGWSDPGIRQLAERAGPTLHIRSALSRADLERCFLDSDIFVMPSLIEGFGLVYLEALAAGCFVIGTTNTGLPDLNPPAEVAAILRPGDLDQLEQTMLQAIARVKCGALDAARIVEFAQTITWEKFRRGIQASVVYDH